MKMVNVHQHLLYAEAANIAHGKLAEDHANIAHGKLAYDHLKCILEHLIDWYHLMLATRQSRASNSYDLKMILKF